mmetsp:Transcript_146280/g.258341  ORF Transcript_146280/g.258341 Transcript_146280/m.258341 type:complete len:252 (-) Transcript_146280:163-918(-)
MAVPGPEKTQAGSQCRNFQRRTAGCTGRPGAKAPSLNVIMALELVVVPVGKTRIGDDLPATASPAALCMMRRASRRDSCPLRSKRTMFRAFANTCNGPLWKLLFSAKIRDFENATRVMPSRKVLWFATSTPTPGACLPLTRIQKKPKTSSIILQPQAVVALAARSKPSLTRTATIKQVPKKVTNTPKNRIGNNVTHTIESLNCSYFVRRQVVFSKGVGISFPRKAGSSKRLPLALLARVCAVLKRFAFLAL